MNHYSQDLGFVCILGNQRTATQNRCLFNAHFCSYFLLISS